MQPIAVELCAKKVAARKGDLRQAFDLCQQAIELAQKEYKRNNNANKKPTLISANSNSTVLGDTKTNGKSSGNGLLTATDPPKVTIRHISAVSQSLIGNSAKDKLNSLTLQQQIVMGTLSKLRQKKNRITMADVSSTHMLRIITHFLRDGIGLYRIRKHCQSQWDYPACHHY